MADTTIDELQIQISAEATQAAKQIKDFAASLRGSASSLSQTAKDLKAVAQGAKEASSATSKGKTEVEGLNETLEDTGKSGEEAADSLEKTGKGARDAGNEAKKASGRFRTLLGDIMRIAKYRAIRSFIKGLTTAIKEGFNMFATWDKESNNGLARVAGNVAAVTEKWTILKGQLGAAAGALFNSFAPVITFILDGLTKIVDVFQMVIRSLQGEYTYYKLIYHEAEATTGAAKELKRVLFGFDDLNVLPSQTGGGAAINNGAWLYEEVPIDSKFLNGIADISNKIKDFLGLTEEGQDIIGGLVGVVGTLIGVKALGGLLGMLPDLISGFKSKNKVLGEQSTKTATETSKVTQLASAFGLATGAAFGLKELLKNWKINIPTTVPSPVPQLQAAYSAASTWLSKKVLTFKTAVASATSKVQTAFNAAKSWVDARVITIKTAVASALSKAQTVFNTAKTWIDARAITIKTAVASALGKAQSVFNSAKSWIDARVITIKTAVASALAKGQAVFNAVKTWVSVRVITIKTAVASALAKGQAVFNAVKTWISARVITIRTAVQSATGMATTVWTAVKAVLSNPIAIPVVLGVAGLAVSLISSLVSLQSQANQRPVSIPTKVITTGIASGLANYLKSVQSRLDGAPLTVSLEVVSSTANKVKSFFSPQGLEGWNIQSSSAVTDKYGYPYSPTMSATDYINWAESTGLNLTAQDRTAAATAVLGVGATLAAPFLPAIAGALGGGALSATELLKLLGVGAYADGGIIPNGVGTLFTAGEKGAEVVANLGHSTGVMNVDQMQEAVAAGNASVVEALYAVIRAIQSKDSNVYLDGAKIGQSVTTYQNNQMRRGVAY